MKKYYVVGEKYLNKLSKHLCFILRHNPASVGISLNKEGFTDIDNLVEQYNIHNNSNIERGWIEKIVETDDKQRYSIRENMIRCNQGHNVDLNVDIPMEIQTPPDVLCHGTGAERLDSIRKEGIKSMSRQYVHLSTDIETATKVGNRHSIIPVILCIDTKEMHQDGYEFKISENGVWQVESVPAKYIKKKITLGHVEDF